MTLKEICKILDNHGMEYSVTDNNILCYVYPFSEEFDRIYYSGGKWFLEEAGGNCNPLTIRGLYLWLGY